jgi:hypothetical protein
MPGNLSTTSDLVQRPGRSIAGCLGLGAFCIAVIFGLWSGDPIESVLGKAIAALFFGFAVGFFAGWITEFAIEDDVRMYCAQNPIPDSDVPVEELVEQVRKEWGSSAEIVAEPVEPEKMVAA